MAETAVNIVIDKLVPLLRDEVTLLRGVRGQVTTIKDQLQLIRAYVKDADERAEMANTSELEKEWVKQTREVAFRIEDVIDEYLFTVGKRRPRKGLVGVLSKIGHLLKTIVPRHKIASEIEDIRETIVRLNQDREALGFNPSSPESSKYGRQMSTSNALRLGAHFLDDAQLVGVDYSRELLTDWLSNADRRRTVISVIGEGGLGKTTIVNNVYKKQKEARSFKCYAWISVSRSQKVETLLKTMMRSFYEYDGNKHAAVEINEITDTGALTNKLREYLQGRKYMIVFDDVWDTAFWEGVEFALPDDNQGSRVMITTRDRGVAEFCKRFAPVHIHELEPLSPDDALSLFNLTAFQFELEGEDCLKELAQLSKDFVKKCDGVPLAIVAIAGLLSGKKKTIYEWQKIHDSLHSKLASDPHLRGYYQVLLESYNDLPYHLKLCLLYFGLFPEGYSISCGRLINLWITEGFVKQKENVNETLEEVAQEYLVELIRRSLVKVSEWSYDKITRSRVHDLMHDFILKKCEELNFCQVTKNVRSSFHEWTRRLSIRTNNNDDNLQSAANYGKVRSCFVFNNKELSMPMIELLLLSFKLLVALDLEDAPLDYLPEAVGNLFLLKYLSLKNTRIKTIPRFIGKLQNLEILNLKDSLVRELPVEINKLIKLRSLLAYTQYVNYLESMSGVKLKAGIGGLRALQKLSHVDVTDGDGVILELKNLKEMRRLTIMKLKRHQGKLLCQSLESMNHLCSLVIAAIEEDEVLDLQSLNVPPQYLQRLYLVGHLERLPKWIPKLKNLVRLRLISSGLKEDPLFVLKDLPQLLELMLDKYEGDELHFKDGWCKKLKKLQLEEMKGLNSLKIDKGALPCLEYLSICSCPQLVEVPVDLQNLETLNVFSFGDMTSQFIESLWLKKGKSYDKIREITYVSQNSAKLPSF